jgi:hypothetical protein
MNLSMMNLSLQGITIAGQPFRVFPDGKWRKNEAATMIQL